MTLTTRTVEALEPGDKSYTARDDRLKGFGRQKINRAKTY